MKQKNLNLSLPCVIELDPSESSKGAILSHHHGILYE